MITVPLNKIILQIITRAFLKVWLNALRNIPLDSCFRMLTISSYFFLFYDVADIEDSILKK